ncbi:DNA polymerase III [Herminiimonas sp. KBW02]|uniref:uracil-DNA glycosylase n=1 Tax=Herminiimonas sp. KBW02 TaxID=2153363 RepID=UPI000F59A7EB|nr:uracil-DNA glycosylase [Herminiimonas sp. KBW02]RQO38575.1 DNA polymerase III [Herminiimonas sp. KBW02]
MSNQDRRIAFLQEMGLGPVWSQRTAVLQTLEPEAAAPEEVTEFIEDSVAVATPLRVAEQSASAWGDDDVAITPAAVPAAPTALVQPATNIGSMNWDQLKAVVSSCTECGLCKGRTQTVFGVGDQKAKWLFVGEGPGRNEDFQGEPFVGPAGKLLDNMFVAMGLKRGENTYIANIVKCRPTDENKRDRAPVAAESDACLPYLQRQIELINPTVIVALGKTAALSLLKLDPATPVARLRGTVHRYADIPVVVTYHPAYLLRTLKDKSKAWADLCLAMQTYADKANG